MNDLPSLFTVTVGGIPRLLFKVRERKGDLLISPKTPENFHSSPLLEDQPTPYKSNKYSVHLSPESAMGINAIKRTVTFCDRPELVILNYTRGMKRDNNFVNIYTQRSADLSNLRYEVNNSNGHVFSLGEYEPDRFVLYYSIWVGNKEREFNIDAVEDMNLFQTMFTNFRLVVLVSYSCLMSDHTGGKRVTATLNLDGATAAMREFFSMVASGRTEAECIAEFDEQRRFLHDYHLETITRRPELQTPKIKDFVILMHSLGFVKQGLRTSEQFIALIDRTIAR